MKCEIGRERGHGKRRVEGGGVGRRWRRERERGRRGWKEGERGRGRRGKGRGRRERKGRGREGCTYLCVCFHGLEHC